MFKELCFSVKLHDERGDSNQMLLEPLLFCDAA